MCVRLFGWGTRCRNNCPHPLSPTPLYHVAVSLEGPEDDKACSAHAIG